MLDAALRAIRRQGHLVALDALVVACSLVLALPTRFLGAPPEPYLDKLWDVGPFILGAYLAANYLFGLYHRIWQYASAQEVLSIASAVATATVAVLVASVLWQPSHPLPSGTILLAAFFCLAGFTALRYRRRLIRGSARRWLLLRRARSGARQRQQRVLIVGAGEAGQLLAWRFLNQKEGETYRLVGFVDDDPAKQGMRVHGLRVLGNRHAIPKLVLTHEIDLIVIAAYNIAAEDFQAILDICEWTPARIKVVPNVFDFIRRSNGAPPIRDVTAEDLFGRKLAEIDRPSCAGLLAGKTVLVTGAAGSIGAELCRQIASFGPRRLVMLDNNESGLHDLTLALREQLAASDGIPAEAVAPLLADVTNEAKLCHVFASHRPQIVFHAAAYKHVPLMEEHPDEAVRVNVLGTWLVADLAARHDAERFVLVSTDKAINPSSVMGATKRLAEMLISREPAGSNGRNGHRSAPDGGRRTRFTGVRFGNVFGSRGSVLPTFQRQIDQGGPVTVTHPEMTRYFMTIPEAVSLIIQAAAFTEDGDIFMLDMGQRINIDALARRLIRLRGLRPELDIPIVYTGVRPGEKLHEELLGDGEERCPTPHPHIFRIRFRNASDRGAIRRRIEELIALAQPGRNEELVAAVWRLVAAWNGGQVLATTAEGSHA